MWYAVFSCVNIRLLELTYRKCSPIHVREDETEGSHTVCLTEQYHLKHKYLKANEIEL